MGYRRHIRSFLVRLPSCHGEGSRKRHPAHAASIIAVIRLRGAPIERSPKVVFTISESVQLARMVLEAVERRK
jgi:hypothetical protein